MSNYLDLLLEQYANPSIEHDPLFESRRRYLMMDAEQKAALDRKVTALFEILDEYETYGRLRPGKGKDALSALDLTSRSTLKRRIDMTVQFLSIHSRDDLVYTLVNRAGRPPMSILSVEEQLLALGSYAVTDWNVFVDPEAGRMNKSTMKLKAEHVYTLLTLVFPHVAQNMQVDGLRRFLEQVVAQDPVTFTYAWEGAKAVWAKFLLKLPSTIREPNICWQMDARDLPIYAKSPDGVVGTVTFVPVVEGFSGIVPAYELVFKKIINESGEVERVAFRRNHVCIVLAYAILLLKTCPLFFYTDDGAQFKALQALMWLFNRAGIEETTIIFGYPEHPWGRGLTEVTQKLVDEALDGQPGFVTDENNWAAHEAAKAAAKLPEEDIRVLIDRHIKRWNTHARAGAQSRWEVYKNTPSTVHLPPLSRSACFILDLASSSRSARCAMGSWNTMAVSGAQKTWIVRLAIAY